MEFGASPTFVPSLQIRRRRPTPASLVLSSDQSSPGGAPFECRCHPRGPPGGRRVAPRGRTGLGGGGGGRSAGALSLGLCPADTDECLATPCQHRCKNSVGSYRCSCRPGYHLHGNRHSCVGECRAPSLRPRAIAAAPRAPRRHPSPTCSHRDPSPRGGNPPRPRALPAPRRAAPGLGAAAGDADALRIPQTSTSAGSRASAVRASTRATTHRAASSAPAGPATGSAGTGCPAKVTARSSTRERPPNSPR